METSPASLQFVRARRQAEQLGLTGRRDRRYSGRINAKLLEAAEENTGLTGSALIEFALRKVAIKDEFWEHNARFAGTIDRDIDLEF